MTPTPRVIAEAWRAVAWFTWYRQQQYYKDSMVAAVDSAEWRMGVAGAVPQSIRFRYHQNHSLKRTRRLLTGGWAS